MIANSSSFLIRPARPEDGARVAAMSVALTHEEGAGASCRFTAEAFRRDGFGTNAAFSCLITEIAGEPAGYALHCADYDTDRLCRSIYLSDLYVEKAARRRGIGGALMAAAAEYGQARGAELMVWGVLRNNHPARRFYATIGREWRGQIECSATDAEFERLLTLPDDGADFRLRMAEVGDCELLAHMLGELLAAIGEPAPANRAHRLVADGFGAHPAFTAIVAEHRGAPVGYAIFWPTYDTEAAGRGGWLSDLYVAPRMRGKGLGRQLIRAVARETAAFGGRFLIWLVHEENEPARAFYRTVGQEWHEGLLCLCEGEAFERLASKAAAFA